VLGEAPHHLDHLPDVDAIVREQQRVHTHSRRGRREGRAPRTEQVRDRPERTEVDRLREPKATQHIATTVMQRHGPRSTSAAPRGTRTVLDRRSAVPSFGYAFDPATPAAPRRDALDPFLTRPRAVVPQGRAYDMVTHDRKRDTATAGRGIDSRPSTAHTTPHPTVQAAAHGPSCAYARPPSLPARCTSSSSWKVCRIGCITACSSIASIV
jgi:hypothetical protein